MTCWGIDLLIMELQQGTGNIKRTAGGYGPSPLFLNTYACVSEAFSSHPATIPGSTIYLRQWLILGLRTHCYKLSPKLLLMMNLICSLNECLPNGWISDNKQPNVDVSFTSAPKLIVETSRFISDHLLPWMQYTYRSTVYSVQLYGNCYINNQKTDYGQHWNLMFYKELAWYNIKALWPHLPDSESSLLAFTHSVKFLLLSVANSFIWFTQKCCYFCSHKIICGNLTSLASLCRHIKSTPVHTWYWHVKITFTKLSSRIVQFRKATDI